MFRVHRHLVVGVSLMALTSQSTLPAWAAIQGASQHESNQSAFNKLKWPCAKGKKNPWKSCSVSEVCKGEGFKAFKNCDQLAAKKWLSWYLRDKNNPFFFINLDSVSQEKDLLAILRQVGHLNIPKERIEYLLRKIKDIVPTVAEGGLKGFLYYFENFKLFAPLGFSLGFALPAVAGAVGGGALALLLILLLAPPTGGFSLFLAGHTIAGGIGGGMAIGGFIGGAAGGFIIMPGFATSIGMVGGMLKNLDNIAEGSPKLPWLQIPFLTDEVVDILQKDLPKLQLLRLDPAKIQVNINKEVDLSHLTLQWLGPSDPNKLKAILDKTKIRRLDWAGIPFKPDELRQAGEILGGHAFEHLDFTGSKMGPDGLAALADGLGGKKLEAETLHLMDVFPHSTKTPGTQIFLAPPTNKFTAGEALGKLLPKLKVNTLNLSRSFWKDEKETIETLNKTLGDQRVKIPNLVLINSFGKHSSVAGEALGKLLLKVECDTLDLSFSRFDESYHINSLAKGLKEGLENGQKLKISELKLVGALSGGFIENALFKDKEMGQALVNLLPHLKGIQTIDLRGNHLNKKDKAAITKKAKELSMAQNVKL